MSGGLVRRRSTISGATSSPLPDTTFVALPVGHNNNNATIQNGSRYYDGTSLSQRAGSTSETSTISSSSAQGGSKYDGAWELDVSGNNNKLNNHFGNITIINNPSITSNSTSPEPVVTPLFEKMLSPADNAQFNAHGRPDDVCHEGTRLRIRTKINNWIAEGKQHVFWLNGLAGAGKSTIARTIAEDHYQKGRQVSTAWTASFFFSKGQNDISHTEKFAISIAVQLARRHMNFQTLLNQALQRDAGIPTKSLLYQWDELILEPLSKLQIGTEIKLLIVIDALDECRKIEEVEKIYEIIVRSRIKLDHGGVRLRFLITSRSKVTPPSIGETREGHQDLSDLPAEEVNEDIRAYLKSTLKGYEFDESQICALVDTTGGLFICAATAGLHIKGIDKLDCHDRMKEILDNLSESDVGKKLDKIYSTVLKSSIHGTSESEEKKKALCVKRKTLLANLALLASPLCLEPLSQLIGQNPREIRAFTEHYSSILHLSEDDSIPFHLHHSCFHDFLFDEAKSQSSGFHVSYDEAQRHMLEHCLRVMEGEKSPGRDVHGWETCRVSLHHDHLNVKHISLRPEVQYACRHWVHHLEQSENLDFGFKKVWPFLETNFLNWLEAMAILRLFSEAILGVKKLKSFTSMGPAGSITISEFLDDASRFALKNRKLAEVAPLDLFSSGILFCPRTSVLRQRFETSLANTCRMNLRSAEETWNAELLTLESHSHWITSIASSSRTGNPLLASCSRDTCVKLWDPNTGELLWSKKVHSEMVNSVAFSCYNTLLLASGASDNTIILWDCMSGKPIKRFTDHESDVNSVVFAPITETQLLASGSNDKTVRIWDCSTDEKEEPLHHSHGVSAVSFSHDAKILATAANKEILLWDWRNRIEIRRFKDHRSRVTSLAFATNPHTPILDSGSDDGKIVIRNYRTSKKTQKIYQVGTVSDIAFLPSPEANLLASASQDGRIQVWDYTTGKLRQTLNGHSVHTSSVAVLSSPHASLMICGADGNLIRIWDLSIIGPEKPSVELPMKGHFDDIFTLTFSSDGNLLASLSHGFDAKNVKIWDPTTGKAIKILQGHSQQVKSIAFSPDQSEPILASGSCDRSIKLWNPGRSDGFENLGCHRDAVTSIVFSPDSQLLASGSRDGSVKTWLLSCRSHHRDFPTRCGSVKCLAFSPDSKRLVSGYCEGSIVVWNRVNGTKMHTLSHHTDEICSINFSPDGKLLASGSSNETVQIWDPETGEMLKNLVDHNAWATTVTFSPDGRLLAADSGPSGRLTTIWEAGSYKPLKLTGHSGIIWSGNSHGITIKDRQWLCREGERLVWLPTEYRQACLALKNGVLALSNSRAHVSFIDISQLGIK